MIEIYRRAAICRAFEDEVFRRVQSKEITCPVYLSSGQEYVPATLSYHLEKHNPAIFIQHRNHSQYLCFGGDMGHLIRELTGGDTGMQGSASISDKNIYGHDGFMGSQAPIAVGYCQAIGRPTICFMGDAAAEEDYVLAALGWASTKSLPILFVVEDNNLAILTEKKVRRSWEISEVSRSMGIDSYDITDDPKAMGIAVEGAFETPMLLNVRTSRLYWHAGAGRDGMKYDRHIEVGLKIADSELVDQEARNIVEKKWRSETQSAN